MITSTLLAVDLSNQAYKASASHRALTSGDTFTGGLYGFMAAVAKAIVKTGATDVVLCEDRRPYRRSEIYPDYKRIRTHTRDEELAAMAAETVVLVKQFAAAVGWPVWAEDGFESDDLIAVATASGAYSEVFAMSNDSDLYQLFKYRCFRLYKGKRGIYTEEDYDREWGLPADKLVAALAMVGTHNEVEGIYGIGPVKAASLILGPPGALRAVREQHLSVIERNEELIRLPHRDMPPTAWWDEDPAARYDERRLARFCGRYDIKLQRWMSEAFEEIGK